MSELSDLAPPALSSECSVAVKQEPSVSVHESAAAEALAAPSVRASSGREDDKSSALRCVLGEFSECCIGALSAQYFSVRPLVLQLLAGCFAAFGSILLPQLSSV